MPKANASTSLSEADPTPEEFLAELRECPVGSKDGLAIIPAKFKACPEGKCLGTGMDCGGGKYHRLGVNVTEMTGLGVDLDHLGGAAMVTVIATLTKRGYAFFHWNTHSHDPDRGDCRLRLLFPFAEPMPIPSPAAWSKHAWRALIAHLGLDGIAAADTMCRDPARAYFTPRKPTEDAVMESDFVPGALLDWRPIVGALDGFAKAAAVSAKPPIEDPERPVALAPLVKRLKESKREELRQLGKGYALTSPPGSRSPGEPSRYEAWRTATAALSMMAEEWMATDALLEVLRPSHQQEQMESPHDFTDWETIVDLLAKARASAPQRKAEKEVANQATKEFWRKLLGNGFGKKRIAPKPKAISGAQDGIAMGPSRREGESTPAASAVPAADSDGGDPAPDTATAELELSDPDANGECRTLKSLTNLGILLNTPDSYAWYFRRNLLEDCTELWGCPEGFPLDPPAPFPDAYTITVRRWLGAHPFRVNFSQEETDRAIEEAATMNAYDPLHDYLTGLEWDGLCRLEDMLVNYFRASTVSEDGRDITPYIQAVSRKWMMSCAARGLRPGCKVDTALIFQGGQGAKKTSALECLGGDWYVPFPKDVENKDSQHQATCGWIGELGELSSLSKSDVETMKEFLTRRFEKYRPPYGRRIVTRPRRIVFAGSTNNDEYLTDSTGNRRFWPVTVGDIDLAGLKRDRDLLWAEAVAYVEAGMEWWLTPEEDAMARLEADARMKSDSMEERIRDVFLAKEPALRPAQVRSIDVADLLMIKGVLDKSTEMRIASALKRLGFCKHRRASWRGWKTPGELLGGPKRPLGTGGPEAKA